MSQSKDLLSIGTFAVITRLSIKALRLYDQLQILKPGHVDRGTGYRYYYAEQIHPARMIRIMREMDMPLATIRQVLAAASPADAETLVRAYLQAQERRVMQLKDEVRNFIQLLHQERTPMSHEVNVKKLAPQQVISVTRRVKVDKLDDVIQASLQGIFALLKEQDAAAGEEPFGMYIGPINEQDDGPIEICVPVSAKVKPQGDMAVKKLPGGNAASVTLLGRQCQFPEILGGYDACVDWIRHNGYKPCGAPREIWFTGQGEDARMEIVWLFE